jgi:hypothetical protein
MSIRTSAWNNGLTILALLILSACKSFQVPPDAGSSDSGNPGGGGQGLSVGGGGRDGGAATGTGGMGLGPSMDAADAPLDAASSPPDMGSGSGAAVGSGGGVGSGGSAGDCLNGSARLCKDDPALRALGNCGQGMETCAAGHWGPCSVQPAAKDACNLLGDDANCDGRPNDGCPCVDGATQACGPAADVGICKRGLQTCAGSVWGACVGQVSAAGRDCTSTADNDCDGSPDNTLDGVCVCAAAASRPCNEHPGQDGTGRCMAGTQSCAVATDKKSSTWAACIGAVAPAAKDTCDSGNDDNCNGIPNEGCSCVANATQSCGPVGDVGICKRGTQTCTAGTWGACIGAVQAAARDCTSSADNNCDGMPDDTIDAVCGCAAGVTRACDQHPGKDGNGPCKAGTQTCVVAADKKSSAWGTCTGAVGPAAADTCDPTNDDNCDGIPHEGCACVNGATRACGPAAIGICKPSTQTCASATWPTACPGAVTAQPRDCSSTKDNDCNGTVDSLDSTCTCAVGTTSACPGATAPQCITGMRTCVLSADKGSSSWSSTCTPLPGAACGTASCTTDPSGNATFTPAGTCNSSGGCTAGVAGPCPNGRACANAIACSTTCSGTTGCANGYTCSGTTCVAKKAQGGTCSVASECATGLFCASGFCCNSACNGACSSCSSANTGVSNGTCAPVKAGTADPLARCAASSVKTCGLDGTCDGAGACRRWDSNQVCNQTCGTSGAITSKCNGQGTCVPGIPVSCQKFTCNGTGCKTACAVDADCASSSDYCASPSCMPRCRTQSRNNMVPNAGFDSAAWVGGGFPRSTMDATGCSTSGSLEVDFGDAGAFSPCFGVTPSRTYFFGFMGLTLSAGADLFCYVVPFSDGACAVRTDSTGAVLPLLGNQSSPPNLVNNVWTQVNETVTTSAATNSAVVSCVIGASYYDMIYFNATSPSF